MTAAAALLSLTACGPSDTGALKPSAPAASGAADPAPYLPNTLLNAPETPPELHLATQTGKVDPRRIAVDWSPLSGPRARPPQRIEWPQAFVATDEPHLVFEFGTSQLPSRVVLYRYWQVGADGVPNQSAGTETLCGFADNDAPCSRVGDGSAPARVVAPIQSTNDAYWVIHAAWPLLGREPAPENVEVVSASWAIRIEQR